MNVIRLCAVVLLLCPLAGCKTTQSLSEVRQEADDREVGPQAALVDVTPAYSEWINQRIEVVRNRYGVNPLKAAKLNGNQDLIDRFVADVFAELGEKVAGSGYSVVVTDVVRLTKAEVWLVENLSADRQEIHRFTYKQSRYRQNKIGIWSGTTPTTKTLSGANHSISPTVRVGGVLMGIDKWAHFFELGYFYHRDGLSRVQRDLTSRYTEGDPSLSKAQRKLGKALAKPMGYGWFGYLGSWSTGVVSQGDMAANEAGYEFYRELSADPVNFLFDATHYDLKSFNETLNPSVLTNGIKSL